MAQGEVYYRPSGGFELGGLIVMLMRGLAAAIIGGALYGVITAHIPFVYLNPIFLLVLFLAVSIAVGIGGRAGKVRSGTALIFGGIISALVLCYVHLFFFVYAKNDYATVILDPMGIWAALTEIAQAGVWSVGSWQPTGDILLGLWSFEAFLLVFGVSYGTWRVLVDEPFCEDCKEWVREHEDYEPLELNATVPDMKGDLERGDFSRLMSLPMVDTSAEEYTRVRVSRCSECEKTMFLTVTAIDVIDYPDESEDEDEVNLVENLIINKEIALQLRNTWEG